VRHIENERLNECHLPRRATTSPVVAWLAIVAIAGVAWYFFLVQVIFGTPVGTNPAPDAVVVVVWLVFGIGLPLFGYAIKLVTTVRMDGVVVRFFPLATRRISLREVAAYQVRRYRAIAEYGGRGSGLGDTKSWRGLRVATRALSSSLLTEHACLSAHNGPKN
jgi:hypothetical protein